MAELRAWHPSLRDRIAWMIGDAVGALGGGNRQRRDATNATRGLADYVPVLGDAIAGDDVANSLEAGDYREAAVNGAGLALGLAPLVGDFASKGLKKLASRSANIYNPPVKPLRPFGADYPGGATADAAGKLVSDLEGRPLSARYIAGRTHVGQPDAQIGPDAYDPIAQAATGRVIEAVAPSSLGQRSVGAVALNRYTGQPEQVFVSSKLAEPQASRVAAHEIGHVIDQTAGEIPVAGLNEELRGVYNSLNNPQGYGKRFGPEQSGYKQDATQRELMAEAIRAYMTDPNYIKTVAPNVAARIRAQVNGNPKLKNIIQFNSLVSAPVGAMGLYGMLDGGGSE